MQQKSEMFILFYILTRESIYFCNNERFAQSWCSKRVKYIQLRDMIGSRGGERSYVPRVLCSPDPMFPGSYVPRVLCSPGPMFPGSYVGGGGGVKHMVANTCIAIDVGIYCGICWHNMSTSMSVTICQHMPLHANIYGNICHYMLNPSPPPPNIGPGEHRTRGI